MSGAYADAITAYSTAIDADPDHVAARVGRGLTLQRLGEHEKALTDFDEAISSFPDWTGAFASYYSRAVSRNALGQHDKALSDCNEAIMRRGEFADALYLRGTIRKALQQVQEAISDMDTVLEIDPTYWEASLERGKLHLLQENWRQAVVDFSVAIDRASLGKTNIRECLYLRGLAEQWLGQHQDAITDFTKVIELAPNDGGAYLRRSLSHREMGDAAMADIDIQAGMSRLHNEGCGP